MRHSFFRYGAVFIMLIFVAACKHEPAATPGTEVSFIRDVQPIIIGNCTASACHGAQGSKEAEPFTNYDEVIENGHIEAGDPDESHLLEEIDEGSMPLGGARLAQRDIDLIRYWILQGAKNN
jgi:hypothetical protein